VTGVTARRAAGKYPAGVATKLDDPSWVDKLVAWGEGPASADCNGGLILGLALLGGRAEFIMALWNPRWEAYGPGTGLKWSTPNKNGSLTGLSKDEDISRELHQLAEDLERGASHELELQYFGHQAP
jgi:hypothetical protein